MAIRDDLTRPHNWASAVAILIIALVVLIVVLAILISAIVAAKLSVPNLYAELVKWQTSIAAVLGFGGLIAAAVVGFHNLIDAQKHQAQLTRERDDDLARRERERDEERNARERFEMALVLRAEISTVTALLGTPRGVIIELQSRMGNGDLTVPEILIQALLEIPTPTSALERMVERLGDLTPGVGTAILGWYHVVEQLRWAPSLLLRQDGGVNLSRADMKFVLSLMDSLESLAEFALGMLSHDLDDLESRYGWPSPATDPAAGAATDLAAARKRRQEAVDLPGEGE